MMVIVVRNGHGDTSSNPKLVYEKKYSEFKPVKLRLKKLTLYHILPEWRGLVNRINMDELSFVEATSLGEGKL